MLLFYTHSASSTQEHIKTLKNLHYNHVFFWQQSGMQTNGRGQRGKVWQSLKGNLYISGYTENVKLLPGQVAITVGVAIANMLESLNLKQEISLKWPNDLLINNKKCGGVLIENNNGYTIGIGININSFPLNTQTPATCLNQFGDFDLWDISLKIQKYVKKSLTIPFDCIKAEWWNFAKKSTDYWVTQKPIEGLITGIGEEGELLVKLPSGELVKKYNPL